jgi:1-acyl-sn-glycerol-3-phosphate acyltransferase
MLDRWRATAGSAWSAWCGGRAAALTARLLTLPARRVLVRLRIDGAEHLPVDGPVIVAANHLSFFDSVLLMFSLPRPVRMLGKAEYTDHRFTNWLFCGAGMIPVRRQHLGEAVHALQLVEDVLLAGDAVGLFPEGTRSRDGLLHRGHPGVAHLALRTGAPIVPVGLEGTDDIMPTGARIVRPFRRATIRLGAPIDPRRLGYERSTHRARRAVTDELMHRIGQLSHQRYDDQYAPIPTTVADAVAGGFSPG